MALSHNKRNNVGLTHRLLLREATAGMVESDSRRARKAIRLISRYFGPGASLKSELAAYDNVLSARGYSRMLAEQVLNETISIASAAKRDERAMQRLREDIIKEYGPEFWDTKISEYRELASVSILIESSRRARVEDAPDKMRVREALVSVMTSPADRAPIVDEAHDALAYSQAIKIFESKYSSLDQQQRELLSAYIGSMFGEAPSRFREAFERSARSVGKAISSCLREQKTAADKVLTERLNEALRELRGMKPVADESTVSRLMMFHTLRKEIETDGE